MDTQQSKHATQAAAVDGQGKRLAGAGPSPHHGRHWRWNGTFVDILMCFVMSVAIIGLYWSSVCVCGAQCVCVATTLGANLVGVCLFRGSSLTSFPHNLPDNLP
jgi:hypothetical protein